VLSEEERKLVGDIVEWSGMSQKLVSNWIASFAYTAELLAAGTASGNDISAFWVKLYGCLDDTIDYLSEQEDFKKDLLQRALDKPKTDWVEFIGTELLLLGSLRELHASMSRDELILIEYERHTQTHPKPFGMIKRSGQPRKDGTISVKSDYKVQLLNEKLATDEINAALSRVYKQSGTVDENAIAVSLATRLLPKIRHIANVCERWRAAGEGA